MESVVSFWNSNYENILISLGIGFVFFVLGPMGLWFSGRKVRKERIRKAKEVMLDLFEGMIVNQEDITNHKLKKLFGAVEREVEVSIDSAYDLDLLFEDLALRFQRSKHLDASQKNNYIKKLEDLSSELEKTGVNEKERIIPRKYADIITSLENSVNTNDLESTNKILEELKKKIHRTDIVDNDPVFRVFYLYKKLIRERPWIMVIVIVVYAFVIASLLYFEKL